VKLKDARPEIQAALERLACKPETSRPFVVVERGDGGPFVQFYGSMTKGINLDLPRQPSLSLALLWSELVFGHLDHSGIKPTDLGWKVEKIDAERGALYATRILEHVLGFSPEDEVQVVEHADGTGRA
jgi:hypothetical protein